MTAAAIATTATVEAATSTRAFYLDLPRRNVEKPGVPQLYHRKCSNVSAAYRPR
jgi:hypothetical protein